MPRFTTVIQTHGPLGNIFAICGTACALMRQIGVPVGEIDALRSEVMAAHSYEEACAAIREWFPLEGDE